MPPDMSTKCDNQMRCESTFAYGASVLISSLNISKEKGISLIEYKKLFKNDFLIKYQNKIDYLLKNNDIIIENNCLKLKEDKFFILDYILRKILF